LTPSSKSHFVTTQICRYKMAQTVFAVPFKWVFLCNPFLVMYLQYSCHWQYSVVLVFHTLKAPLNLMGFQGFLQLPSSSCSKCPALAWTIFKPGDNWLFHPCLSLGWRLHSRCQVPNTTFIFTIFLIFST
jgi:hypothetical protein